MSREMDSLTEIEKNSGKVLSEDELGEVAGGASRVPGKINHYHCEKYLRTGRFKELEGLLPTWCQEGIIFDFEIEIMDSDDWVTWVKLDMLYFEEKESDFFTAWCSWCSTL